MTENVKSGRDYFFSAKLKNSISFTWLWDTSDANYKNRTMKARICLSQERNRPNQSMIKYNM